MKFRIRLLFLLTTILSCMLLKLVVQTTSHPSHIQHVGVFYRPLHSSQIPMASIGQLNPGRILWVSTDQVRCSSPRWHFGAQVSRSNSIDPRPARVDSAVVLASIRST